MADATLITAIRNAPNSAALMRAIERARPGNAIGIHRLGTSTAWEATDRGGPLIGSCAFSELKFKLASLLDNVSEPEEGLYEDAACLEPIKGDRTLPSVFFWRSGGALHRYWYQGRETYEVHERGEDDFGRTQWIGCGTTNISDDDTADDFIEQRTY
ncbi:MULTISPECIES: hypothetical protein [Methylobacterium]|uniref:Uncharacterized protein n=2 Tax=Methylobacterium TaxID=407 RepID=A0A0C6FBQ6_9HYPH|nr:hypothetical protein [Methylobacterium aquaticum]QRE77160.1 hypothetical protein F1D61_29730 [Methylobacterium aquaticum]BAQ45888.1 hypothetical protein Maq22A_c13355 [Methylobacterium aquaticum]